MKLFKWILTNASFAGLLYAGVVHDVVGAGRLATAWAVLCAIVWVLTACCDATCKLAASRKWPVPDKVDMLVELSCAAFAVWHGWWITAVALVVAAVFHAGIRASGKERA